MCFKTEPFEINGDGGGRSGTVRGRSSRYFFASMVFAVINKTWQLLKMLLRLTHDLFALVLQQYGNVSIDTEHCAGFSAIAKHLVGFS